MAAAQKQMQTQKQTQKKKEKKVMIGLEVHCQLDTKSKLFCTCPTSGVDEPNTAICPICLGLPGSKPQLNRAALHAGIKLCLALNCTFAKTLVFSRKTYFYPDLAKNFQITQYELPLGKKGSLSVEGKPITIRRVHMEEDPAALTHAQAATLIDYNRSGIPLLEIVTEPVFESPEQARDFMKVLLGVLKYLKIYDPQNGIVKADANVSVAKTNFTRVEIKNVTGFKEIERALHYEIVRQEERPGEVKQETRGWDAAKGLTFSLRAKELEEDYGYIIEPDLPELELGKALIDKLKKEIPELPQQKADRWTKELKINAVDSSILAADPAVADFCEAVFKTVDPIFASKWLRRDFLAALNEATLQVEESKVTPAQVAELIGMIKAGQLTPLIAKKLMPELVVKPFSPKERAKKEGLLAVADESAIKKLCEEAIAENPDAVKDYKAGQEKAFHFLVGKVMAKTKGRATPDLVNRLMKELLG